MTNSMEIDGLIVMIGVHTLTRESQEVMSMSTSISGVGFTDSDEDVETIIMVDADIPVEHHHLKSPRQSNITLKSNTTRVRVRCI